MEIVILLAAITGSGGVVASFAWLWHRLAVLERTAGAGASSQLHEEIAATRAELADTRQRLLELDARVDFLDRLLEASAEERRLKAGRTPGTGVG